MKVKITSYINKKNSNGLKKCLREADSFNNQGQWDKAEELYNLLLLKAVKNEDLGIQALVTRKLGEIKRKKGDSLAALKLLRTSLNIFRKIDDRKELSYLYNSIGLIFFGRGKWRKVRHYFALSLNIARTIDERKLTGQIFNNLGILSQIMGRDDNALRYFRRTLPSYESIGYHRGIAQTYNNIGMLYRDREEWEEARSYYEKSHRLSTELKDLNMTGISSLNLALATIHLDQLSMAEEFCNKAYSIFKKVGDKLGMAESFLYYGIIYRRKKDPKRSEMYFKKSIQMNKKTNNFLGLAEAYREIGLLYQDEGKSKDVLRYLGQSFKVFGELQAKRYVDDIDEKIKYLEEIYFKITKEMGEEVESKDTYTYGHCRRVAQYSMLLAEEMDLTENEKKALLIAAFLHDLGKVKISRKILTKPKKLTPDEYLIIMKHPGWGVEMLESVEFPWEVKSLILYHQERYDGKGYPEGLKGQDIPICARIIAISDFFDALTTDRPYRKALSIDEAFSIMRREKGTFFEPEMFNIFEMLIKNRFDTNWDRIIDFNDEDFSVTWQEVVDKVTTDKKTATEAKVVGS
jgi:putative nucleotidyltransferase with HDIG domain